MRSLIAGVGLIAAVMMVPCTALAGAPNYDCVIGGSAHVAIDAHAGVVDAIGIGPGSAIWTHLDGVRQAGGSLDFIAKLRGVSWRFAIRGEGKSVVLTSQSGGLRGHCVFIPGNFALRLADNGGSVLRASPNDRSRRMLAIAVGTPVWERPDVQVGAWFHISTFIARSGRLSARTGWLRQRKPSVARIS